MDTQTIWISHSRTPQGNYRCRQNFVSDFCNSRIFSKKIVALSDFDDILEQISDTNFKGSLLHTASLIDYKNGLENRTKSIFCKEYLMTVAMVAYLRKNFYLTDIVNEKIGIFHAAGLIGFWDRRSKTAIERHATVSDEQKPITFNNLEGMFVVYLYACGASIMCWLAEIILNFMKGSVAGRVFKKKKSVFVCHK